MPATDSLRHHPNLQDLVQSCQARHPEDEELDVYLQVCPEHEARSTAAAEVRDVEGPIVRKVIKKIFDVYPFEQNHEMAVTKATRDVRMVVIYANLSMLLNDADWMRDKLLLWMTRILESFRWPDKSDNKQYVFVAEPAIMEKIETLKPYNRSTFETYHMLKEEMRKSLSPEAFEQIGPYLQLATDTLAND